MTALGESAHAGAAFFRAVRAIALAGVIAAALSLAVLRVYIEPIFGPSDEDDHFDYAISISRAGHLLSARNALGFPTADLESAFLQTYADRPRVYLNPGERVRPGYGTHQYFRRIDERSSAELPNPTEALNAPDHPNPVLISMYPFGYYALDAVAIAAAWRFGHSLASAFFAARLFSVGLLAITLVVAYGTARELRFSRTAATAFVAIVGCFTLTTFVASYVQPDNLAATAVTAIGYFALRMRRHAHLGEWTGLALAFGALTITKYQTALCVGVAAWPMVALYAYRRIRDPLGVAGRIGLALLPAVAALAVQTTVIGTNPQFETSLGTHFVVFTNPAEVASDAGKFVAGLGQGLWYFFIGNVTPPLTHDYRYAAAISYWNEYGNLDTPVTLISPAVDRIARFGIALGTAAMVVLVALGALRCAVRVVRLARRGRPLLALRLATADVPLNAYAVFVVFMVLFYSLTDNHWRTSGRNFFPFIVAAMLVALRFGPAALPRRVARPVSRTMFALLGLYAIVGSYAAAGAVVDRYYGPPALPGLAQLRPARAGALLVNSLTIAEPDGAMQTVSAIDRPVPVLRIVQGERFDIEGLAADLTTGGAAGGVIVRLDGLREYHAGFGYSHEDFADRFGDASLFWSGFRAEIPTGDLPLGPHRLRFWVVSADRTSASPVAPQVNVEIVAPGSPAAAPPSRILAVDPPSGRLPLRFDVPGDYTGSVDQISPLFDATYWAQGPAWLPRGAYLYVKGWGVDELDARPLGPIVAGVDGVERAVAHTGLVRPDVVLGLSALPLRATGGAGWYAVLPTDSLAPGSHALRVTLIDPRTKRKVVLLRSSFTVL